MRGNHVLKVVAHASPPLSPTPGFRQYDFYVDGQTFFSFPKVYRLGLAPNDPRNAPSSPVRLADRNSSRRSTGIASIEAPHNMDEVRYCTIYSFGFSFFFLWAQHTVVSHGQFCIYPIITGGSVFAGGN